MFWRVIKCLGACACSWDRVCGVRKLSEEGERSTMLRLRYVSRLVVLATSHSQNMGIRVGDTK